MKKLGILLMLGALTGGLHASGVKESDNELRNKFIIETVNLAIQLIKNEKENLQGLTGDQASERMDNLLQSIKNLPDGATLLEIKSIPIDYLNFANLPQHGGYESVLDAMLERFQGIANLNIAGLIA